MTDSNSGAASENRPYLGDPQVVTKLLQGVARETIQCRVACKQGILSPEDARAIEEKEATAAARALLGRDKKYAVDANWNVPGVIDGFLKNELSLDEKGAEPILVAGLMKFVGEVHTKLDLLNNPKADPKSETQIKDVLEKYRDVLLGLHLNQAGADSSEAPAAAPIPSAPPSISVTNVPPPPPAPVRAPQVAAPTPTPAPIAPVPTSTPKAAPKPVPVQAESKGGNGGMLKWAALLILLLLIGGIAFFVTNKPKTEKPPEPVAKVEPPPAPPAPPKIIGAAPVLNSNGTLDLIDEAGGTLRTITAKNGRKIVHLYDTARVDGKSTFLVATEGADDTYDIWLMDEEGEARLVSPKAWDGKLTRSGTYVAYTTLDHTLIVEDLQGKQVAKADGAHDFAWAPDGTSLVFLRAGDGHSITHPTSLELAKLQVADQKIVTLTGGFYDNVRPMIQPDGTIFVVAGSATGLPSFWKIPVAGGEPQQVTNVRIDETHAAWVPTPFSTAQWSNNGKWLIYDYKEGHVEQIWGLEFDDKGAFVRATRIGEGLLPRWINEGKFVSLKNVDGTLKAQVQTIP